MTHDISHDYVIPSQKVSYTISTPDERPRRAPGLVVGTPPCQESC